jgi:hypothetical protein
MALAGFSWAHRAEKRNHEFLVAAYPRFTGKKCKQMGARIFSAGVFAASEYIYIYIYFIYIYIYIYIYKTKHCYGQQ